MLCFLLLTRILENGDIAFQKFILKNMCQFNVLGFKIETFTANSIYCCNNRNNSFFYTTRIYVR